MTDGPLSALAPYPAPLPLPPDYDRQAPTPEQLRATLTGVGSSRDWAGVSWPELITALLALGRTDIPLSRLAEGHVDALRIIAQAGASPRPDALYGVWASRSQRTGVQGRWVSGRLVLDGTIRFASGAGILDRALVPVWLSGDEHLLVDLAVAGLPVEDGDWVTTAMEVSRSHTIPVAQITVAAEDQIGPTNFYLARPAFFPGGVGVAACWAGGAARVADLTQARVPEPSAAIQARLGRIRVQLATAAALVDTAARRLDRPAGRQRARPGRAAGAEHRDPGRSGRRRARRARGGPSSGRTRGPGVRRESDSGRPRSAAVRAAAERRRRRALPRRAPRVMVEPFDVVVAVPARDEEARIDGCLSSVLAAIRRRPIRGCDRRRLGRRRGPLLPRPHRSAGSQQAGSSVPSRRHGVGVGRPGTGRRGPVRADPPHARRLDPATGPDVAVQHRRRHDGAGIVDHLRPPAGRREPLGDGGRASWTWTSTRCRCRCGSRMIG